MSRRRKTAHRQGQVRQSGRGDDRVILGRVDALSADSPPVTAYAIERSDGRLATAGDVFDAAPYGFVVAKGSPPLGPVLQQAVQELIDSGVYAQIAERWGLEDGMIDTAQINAAPS